MAYVAVMSLVQTLEELLQEKPHWISDETRIMVDSLLVSLKYFQDFLENSTSKTRQFEELEREIRSAVDEVEDVIELKINKTMKREAFSKSLLGTLVEKIGALKREVMGCRFGKNEVLNETMERKALRETLSPLVEKIDSVKRNVMGSIFVTDEVQGGPDDPTNEEDLPTGASFPGHSSRYVAKLNPESIVVGLEDDLMRIMNRLKGPMPTREIIPILGMGGIGKTTLAKKAYDDPEIKCRFDIHIWLTVLQEYRIRNLLLCVVSCISELTNEIKEQTDDKLMEMIYQKLYRRRYLVVMDDIWSTDLLDIMSRTFPDDNNGSRIILTSRLNDVAMCVDPDNTPHEMNLLNLDESWKLLHDKVFGVQQQQICPPELEDIGKQVAQKCQGLPLALLVAAGHLSKIARTRESWKDAAKSVSKVIAYESDICLGVLSLSYNYLPNYLKPCFLYMGVFPEDMEVDIKVLINLWVSEGFTRKERLKSWEQEGRECLEDLVSRNLLMVRKRRLNGEGKTCGVHDLVRDLILREAEKEKFLHVSRIHEATNPSEDELGVRRYGYHSYVIDDDDCWESLSSITRTVHFFYGLFHDSLLERFKLLRVLAILDSEFYYFPVEITKLVHLRYLQFNCRDDIHCSVSELYNLQTLIIRQRGDEPQTIPASIWKMKHLRHIDISRKCFIRSRDVKSGFKLENLKELSHLSLSSCNFALFSAIPNLKRLKVLGICENPQHLNSLSSLKELEILKFSGGKLIPGIPSKHALPTSLKMLTLTGAYLPWEHVANIVTLPNLQVLKIKVRGFHGDVWKLNDEEIFNQLQFLLIDRTNLKRWELAGSDNFPKLQRLVLKGCTYLEEIPKDFGEMCTLESIEVHNCRTSAVESVKEIQEEQESLGNCLSVIIDGIEYCKAQES